MSTHRAPPPECAQCGATLRPDARACPDCGADERTGWRETSVYDGIDLPDEPEATPQESESGVGSDRRRVNGIAWYWWCVALAVLLGSVLAVLGLR